MWLLPQWQAGRQRGSPDRRRDRTRRPGAVRLHHRRPAAATAAGPRASPAPRSAARRAPIEALREIAADILARYGIDTPSSHRAAPLGTEARAAVLQRRAFAALTRGESAAPDAALLAESAQHATMFVLRNEAAVLRDEGHSGARAVLRRWPPPRVSPWLHAFCAKAPPPEPADVTARWRPSSPPCAPRRSTTWRSARPCAAKAGRPPRPQSRARPMRRVLVCHGRPTPFSSRCSAQPAHAGPPAALTPPGFFGFLFSRRTRCAESSFWRTVFRSNPVRRAVSERFSPVLPEDVLHVRLDELVGVDRPLLAFGPTIPLLGWHVLSGVGLSAGERAPWVRGAPLAAIACIALPAPGAACFRRSRRRPR